MPKASVPKKSKRKTTNPVSVMKELGIRGNLSVLKHPITSEMIKSTPASRKDAIRWAKEITSLGMKEATLRYELEEFKKLKDNQVEHIVPSNTLDSEEASQLLDSLYNELSVIGSSTADSAEETIPSWQTNSPRALKLAKKLELNKHRAPRYQHGL